MFIAITAKKMKKSHQHLTSSPVSPTTIPTPPAVIPTPLTAIPVPPAVIPTHLTVIPAPLTVIPVQAGIYKVVQVITAYRFRLKATGITGWVNTGMTGWVNTGMTGWVNTRMRRWMRTRMMEWMKAGRIRVSKVRRSSLARFEATRNINKTTKHAIQQGFTLLEVVLVLFLVGLMASATLMLTENVEDQAKYDETKRRMEMMRKAIVGDPTRTINGAPEISGFVADMGRLPGCVRELLDAQDCADPANGLTQWNIDVSTGIGSGWRGPYIQVIPEKNGELRFRDGYGNLDSSTAIDAKNSGWITYDISGAEMSLASDSFSITDSADDIEANPLVVASDWQINSININFINQNTSDALPTADVELLLRVYLSGSDYDDADDIGNTGSLTFDASNAVPANGGSIQKTFVFNNLTAIPTIGRRAYAVVCYEVPPVDPADYVIFDGDCDNPGNTVPTSSDIKHFTVVPRQNVTLDWIIQ